MIERRNGTIRSKRLNDDLLDSPFKIDQRSFGDIMGYLSSYLEEINYFDLNNQTDGNWKVLIEDDPIIFMVLIINEPLDHLNLMVHNNDRDNSSDSSDLKKLDALLCWYKKILEWHKTLMRLGEKKLAYKIKNVHADVLTYQRIDLINYRQHLVKEQKKKNDETPPVKMMMSPPPLPKPDIIDLGKALHTFQKAINHIQEFTREYLEKSIYKKNTLKPNNAMYITFALLFKKIQAQLNALSKRHLDFYYNDVLHQQNNSGKPTRAIVNFELLPGIEYSLIDKGTQLSAGKQFGSKTEVIFQTEKPLGVQQMDLVEIQTLFLNTNPYIKIGTNSPLIYSISKNELINKGKDVGDREDWFVFGANKQRMQSTRINAEKAANLGFIIGSPVLFLSEGRREINIRINLETSSSGNIFWKLLNEIRTNRKISMDTVFSDVFDQSFKIYYTGKKGWLEFDNYAVSYNEASNYFSINLVLENDKPELVKSILIDEKLSWPSIKIELNEFAPVYLYSFLKGVEVDSIHIDVNVERIRNLSLYNNIGKLPLDKSFDLFGPLPEKGSFLMLGKSELFQKNINTLNIKIAWASVPDDFGGFDSYYKGYSGCISNDSFNVQITALSNSYWQPTNLAQAPVVNLFSTTKCITPEGYESCILDKKSNVEFDQFKEFASSGEYDLTDPLVYSISSQSGFIKLSLVSPDQAFGNETYLKEFADISVYNAKNKNQLPYPNKPFTPKVNAVSIDYKASANLYFNQETSKSNINETNVGEFMHITPFGIEEVIANHRVKKHTLLTDFEAEGYLFLGLSNVKRTTTISIYFHFLRSGTAIKINNDELTWEYLKGNKWVEFEKGDIILDETNGFIKSGIVELVLQVADRDSEKPDTNMYWVRVSTKSNAPHYPKIKSVCLNAVISKCISKDAIVIGKSLPEGSINKLIGKFPDIKLVNQPGSSADGQEIEEETQFYTRVSERLRHKSRALTIWDYERLVLENFDEVQVVKCSNLDDSFKPVPGNVKVIVLSSKWTHDERHYFNQNMLDKIESFLKKISNPFVDIQVVNPSVEYLLVNCIVKFMPEDNGGYYINKLNKDISEFLFPFSVIDNDERGIGGSIVPTMVVSFVENLPYIKRVEKLNIEHIINTGINKYSLGVHQSNDEIKTSTPWSILSPVEQHNIIGNADKIEVGIGNMKIGLDLILGNISHEDLETASVADTGELSEQNSMSNDAIFVFKNKTTER